MNINFPIFASAPFLVIVLTMGQFFAHIEMTKNEQNTDQQKSHGASEKVDVLRSSIASASSSSAHASAGEHQTEAQTSEAKALARAREKHPIEEEQVALDYVLEQLHSYDEKSIPKTEEDEDELVAAMAQHNYFSSDDENADAFGVVLSPPLSKSMDEVYEQISKAPKASSASQTAADGNNKSASKLLAQPSATMSMLNKVAAEFQEMRRHRAVLKVYELLNVQEKITTELLEKGMEGEAQKDAIDAYFTKFKQVTEYLQNNPTKDAADKLEPIVQKIEKPKENAKFDTELAAMDKIREHIRESEQDFRVKNEIIAEGTETISGGVQSVVEYQMEKRVKKELIYLAKAKRNSSLPVKIILEFFGTLDLAMAYLKRVDNYIKEDLSGESSFPRYYIRVEARIVLITTAISIVQKKVAEKLHFSGNLTNIAGPIEKDFTKNVLAKRPAAKHEIVQMATLDSTIATEEQVLLLVLSHFLQRAQILLGNAQKHLKSIEKDIELINSVGLMTKSTEILLKLRRELLSLDEMNDKSVE